MPKFPLQCQCDDDSLSGPSADGIESCVLARLIVSAEGSGVAIPLNY